MASLDLNLVVALRALLEERSVTAAGRRVGLSQPAMSASLARLRRHFGDELLVRNGVGYGLTAVGAALLDRTATAWESLEVLFTGETRFDAARAEREFVLLASDFAVASFGAELAHEVGAIAPGIRLRFSLFPDNLLTDVGSILARVDGLVLPHGLVSGYPAVEILEDRWVLIVASDHPDVGEEVTLDTLARLPWVAFRSPYSTPAGRQLSMLGVEPRIEIFTDTFLSMAALVAGSRRIALVQERLARRFAEVCGIRVLECPYPAAPLREALWWHPVHRHDAAHQWLREIAARIGSRPLSRAGFASRAGL